jgi:FAD/FMN-containing dehydrogenase
MEEFSKDQIAALSNLVADVQPGVLRKELNRQAGKQGLFFLPDPGQDFYVIVRGPLYFVRCRGPNSKTRFRVSIFWFKGSAFKGSRVN